jgi:3-dehydroquinate dehydratase-2
MRVFVLNGPNLNLLGNRQPEIYGSRTLADINDIVSAEAAELGIQVRSEQYNGEGQIVDALHGARGNFDGVALNPGAYAHYSYAIADAVAAIEIPVVEVHLSNLNAREDFRRVSVTARACRGMISGFGAVSYVLALHALKELLEKSL